MGTPVIGSAAGGNPELVVDGESGLLVPPRDPPALAAAIRGLLATRPASARLGRGRTRAGRSRASPRRSGSTGSRRSTGASSPKEPHQERQEERQHQAGDDRKGDRPVAAPHDHVSRKPPEPPGDQRPQEPGDDEHRTHRQEQSPNGGLETAIHRRENIAGSSSGATGSPAIAMTEDTSARSHPILRIRDLPAEERPRERLARLGAAALSNEELLSLLLSSGTRGASSLDRARSLLAAHGGLVALAGLSGAELRRERGIKGARAAVIEASFELGRRLGTETSRRATSSTSRRSSRSTCAGRAETARRSARARCS